jgi:hypothetical protein
MYYYNDTYLYHNADVSSQGGGGVWRPYTEQLQSFGPGTFTLNSRHDAANCYCGMYAPPYANDPYGTASSYLTVQRPTISSSNSPFYLGGALDSGTQSAQSRLTANPNGAPDDSTVEWWPLAGGNLYTLTSVPSNPLSNDYTAVMQASQCGSYGQVAVSFDGFYSDTFWIFNNAPADIQQMWGSPGDTVIVPSPPYNPGWQTWYQYKVLDMCGNPINFIETTESLSGWSWPNGDNWGTFAPGHWTQNSQFDEWGDFVDYLFETNVAGTNRQVWPGGQNALNEDGSSVGAALSQQFYGGSPINGQGLSLGAFWSMTHYLDHGKSIR